MVKKTEDARIAAIKRGIDLGRTLQHAHPEIARLYREGLSLREIATQLDVASSYSVSDRIAYGALQTAIAGHKGGFDRETYDGLIGEEERQRISKDHQIKGSVNRGTMTHKARTGIHGLTSEQRSKNSAMAAVPAALAKGQNPWTREERELAYDLSQESYFRKGSKTNTLRVAQALNGFYHGGQEVRNAHTVQYALYRYRRSLENRAE